MRFYWAYLFFLITWISNSQNNTFKEIFEIDESLKGSSIAYCVSDLAKQTTLAEYHSHELLIPASTLKVFTTYVALKVLGKNFQYQTLIYYTGNFNTQTGEIDGDLIIKGSGDPTLQSENFYAKENLCAEWAKILKEKGIKKITGNIILDESAFDERIPDDWIWADISNYFGAIPRGINYKDNKFKIYFNTGTSGTKAELIKTSPNYYSEKYILNSDVDVKGNDDQAYVYGHPFSFERTISGSLPANKTNYDIEAVLPNPALLLGENLVDELLHQGIECRKKKISTSTNSNIKLDKTKLLYTHLSPTLDKIIYYTNLTSNNLYCESLLKTIGNGSSQKGIEILKEKMVQLNLNTKEIFMVDGNGLSRANTVTANLQTQLLNKIYKDTLAYKIIYNSCAIAGKNGSMSSIGKNTFLENNLRAKTGYINRVRAYCGYLNSKTGKHLAFSIMLNNYNCSASEARNKIEKFLLSIAEL